MALNLKWRKAQALLGTIDWMKQTRRREEYHLHIFPGFAWTKRKGKEEEEAYTQLLSIVEYMSIPTLASTVSPSNHNTFLPYSPISSICSGWKIRLKWDFCNVKYSLLHFLKAYLSIEYYNGIRKPSYNDVLVQCNPISTNYIFKNIIYILFL